MPDRPQVILSGFADEGPEDKKAEAQLTMLAALGMSYYSLRWIDAGQGVRNVMDLTRPEIDNLRKLQARYGVRVSSIGSPIGKVKLLDREDGSSNRYVPFARYLREEVARAVDLAEEFETRLIRGFSFYPPRGEDPAGYVDAAADRLGEIAALCQGRGVFFGLEVEANLVGQSGDLLRALHRKVKNPHLLLIFDGGNLSSQNLTAVETFEQYRAMRDGIGWLHVKDYRIDPGLEWKGFVDEERLENFVPADRGDSGHEAILLDFRNRIPALARKLRRLGIPGVFLDLEPHLRGGGQFGGYSGVDGFGVALRSLTRLLDYVGIDYRLTDYDDL